MALTLDALCCFCTLLHSNSMEVVALMKLALILLMILALFCTVIHVPTCASVFAKFNFFGSNLASHTSNFPFKSCFKSQFCLYFYSILFLNHNLKQESLQKILKRTFSFLTPCFFQFIKNRKTKRICLCSKSN